MYRQSQIKILLKELFFRKKTKLRQLRRIIKNISTEMTISKNQHRDIKLQQINTHRENQRRSNKKVNRRIKIEKAPGDDKIRADMEKSLPLGEIEHNEHSNKNQHIKRFYNRHYEAKIQERGHQKKY